MLNALNFVKGAIARKDFVPALQHFLIRDGRVKSFNGELGLSSPIPVDLNIAPRADTFIQAIEACSDTVELFMSGSEKLVVKSGDFKTHVECVEASTFPEYPLQGEIVKLDDSLLPALAYLEPFVANDASRPWACGVLLSGESAFATNNIVLQEYWLGFNFPHRVNLPIMAIRELLRINENPIYLQMTDNRLVFHFTGDRWLSTQLLSVEWPDVTPLFAEQGEQHIFPAGFFEALERLAPFADELGRVYLLGSLVSTHANPELTGACIEVPDLYMVGKGIYNIHALLKLRKAVATIDFACYPKPVPFFGEAARGIIVGLIS